jgi:hypothetical protein
MSKRRASSLKRKQVGKEEEYHFEDDDELDSDDEDLPTSAIKEVTDNEDAPGLYVVRYFTDHSLLIIFRWPTPTAKVDLRYAHNR